MNFHNKVLRVLPWLLVAAHWLPLQTHAQDKVPTVSINSPGGAVTGQVFVEDQRLHYRVSFHNRPVILDSPLGITVNQQDLGRNVSLGQTATRQVKSQYATRGVHSLAHNHYRETTIDIHSPGHPVWQLQLRAYEDGFAYRYRLSYEGTGKTMRVNSERSSWTLPVGSQVWYFERNSGWKLKTYAGEWLKAAVEQLSTVSETGPIQGPPLIVELTEGHGYAVLTEAALYNYSGMRLEALGTNRIQANFTEGDAGFSVSTAASVASKETLATPWRVTMLGDDLNALVNSDLITNLNPAPDEALFANTDYIKPGRAVWRWWSRETGTPKQEREFVDYAHALGFEYSLVDDGWEAWRNAWAELSQLTAYADPQQVKILVWKDWNQVSDPSENWSALRTFLDGVSQAGAAGVKLDFMNAESRDRILFEEAALRLAAERKLMVVFHGIQKPTGEMRTYPNEVSREGIRGLELNRMGQPLTASHNAALPFTRFLVGHGDYTPLGYSLPGETTYAHQLATVVLFTSPFQVIAEHPTMLLEDEAVAAGLDMLKAIPTVWDETRVLEPSRIGELAIMARRSGDHWFLAMLNGTNHSMTLETLDLSFLGEGSYTAEAVFSPKRHRLQRKMTPALSGSSQYPVTLLPADGYVIRFSPSI